MLKANLYHLYTLHIAGNTVGHDGCQSVRTKMPPTKIPYLNSNNPEKEVRVSRDRPSRTRTMDYTEVGGVWNVSALSSDVPPSTDLPVLGGRCDAIEAGDLRNDLVDSPERLGGDKA